jgi:hypothetical protein
MGYDRKYEIVKEKRVGFNLTREISMMCVFYPSTC